MALQYPDSSWDSSVGNASPIGLSKEEYEATNPDPHRPKMSKEEVNRVLGVEALEVAKYKIEIHFAPKRTTKGPNLGAIIIVESGTKEANGEGDSPMFFCGYEDCHKPFSSELLKDEFASCPHCSRPQYRTPQGSPVQSVAQKVPLPSITDVLAFRLTTSTLAAKVHQLFWLLGGDADIYVKYRDVDIRQVPDNRDMLVKARIFQPVMYPLHNILKDSRAGADLCRRFQALLES